MSANRGVVLGCYRYQGQNGFMFEKILNDYGESMPTLVCNSRQDFDHEHLHCAEDAVEEHGQGGVY